MRKIPGLFIATAVAVNNGLSLAATPADESTVGGPEPSAMIEPLSYGNAISVILSLLLVLGLLFACAWVLRRGRGVMGGATQKIAVTSQLSLGVKEKILLLRVGEENILVGYSGNTLTGLHAWHGDVPPDIETPVPVAGFAEYLTQLKGQGAKR